MLWEKVYITQHFWNFKTVFTAHSVLASVNCPLMMFTSHSEKIVETVCLSLTSNVISFQPFQGDAAGVSPVHATAHPASGNVKAWPHVLVHHLSLNGKGEEAPVHQSASQSRRCLSLGGVLQAKLVPRTLGFFFFFFSVAYKMMYLGVCSMHWNFWKLLWGSPFALGRCLQLDRTGRQFIGSQRVVEVGRKSEAVQVGLPCL